MTLKTSSSLIDTWSAMHEGKTTACFCVGRQGGEPYCPCEMRFRGVFKRDGRWIEPAVAERDLGPAR